MLLVDYAADQKGIGDPVRGQTRQRKYLNILFNFTLKNVSVCIHFCLQMISENTDGMERTERLMYPLSGRTAGRQKSPD